MQAPFDRVGPCRAWLEPPGWLKPATACKDQIDRTGNHQEDLRMAGAMTEIPVNGDAVPAYVSLPPAGSGPGVVVIQEWWGLVPHIRNVADRLAAQGFVALAPDLYRGKETSEPDEAGKLIMEMQLDQAAKDMAAAVDALLAMPETTGQGAGVIGFCVGGGLALYLASLKAEVAAVVCYYGFPRPGLEWDLSAVKGAVLGHFAEHDDDYCPPELVESMERELRQAGVEVTFHTYPGTTHAFFNDDRPEVYHADAAETSWRRTLDFLRGHLGQTS
jgi:carboxymethylenebutenolidase